MKRIFFIIIASTFSIFFLNNCKVQKNIAGYYSYKTECLGIELDGSQTVKARGNGKNRSHAATQAMKNAVRDVLFKGIIDGKPECDKRPVVPEVNALKEYESYFNRFFADGGEYKKFVSLKDERFGQKIVGDRRSSGRYVTYDVILRIQRSELKQKMITDGILK